MSYWDFLIMNRLQDTRSKRGSIFAEVLLEWKLREHLSPGCIGKDGCVERKRRIQEGEE